MGIMKRGLPAMAVACIAMPVLAQTNVQRTDAADNVGTSDNRRQQSRFVEEIVVTAQRREERLVDAPLSVAVVDGEQLDSSNGQGLAEALSRVPGVVNAVGLSGGSNRLGASAGAVIIRGVAPVASVGGGTTAYYLDSVPWGFVNSAATPDANAYDMERLEVLRGPQGTLFGASALNGVVRVLTRKPNLDEFEFKARTSISGTHGGSENYHADAAMNVPIVEGKLAARAVVGFQDLSGWLDNVNEKDANDTQVDNYRLRIAAEPTDHLTLGLQAWISRTDVGAPSNSPNGKTRPSSIDERAALDFNLYGFNVGYDFDAFTFTSATSYIDFENVGRFDYRPLTGADYFQNAVFASEVFAQEFALSSTGNGDWRWSLGAIYRDVEDKNLLLRTVAATGAFAPGYLAPTIDRRTSESYAVFGELTRLFLDRQFELTVGLRQFHDETEFTEVSNRTVASGVPAEGLVHSTGEFDHLTPRLVAAWHPSPNATLYASYGEGFRSGLSQSAAAATRGYAPAEPDELRNFEVGYKASAWGGRLNIETAAYYVDWQNVLQNLQVVLSTTPLIIGPAVVNAGSVSGLGFEAGASVDVVDGLTFSGSVSWNDLEFDDDVFDGAAIIYAKGARLQYSPEYTLAAAVDYEFLLGDGFDGHVSISANYVPEQSSVAGPTYRSIVEEAMIARASFTLSASDHWAAALFVENLTDEEAIAHDPFNSLITPPGAWDNYQRPRTIGLQVEYRY